RRFSRSRTLPTESLGELRASGRLASALTFLGLVRRPINLSLPPTATDRRQARRKQPCEQAETGVISMMSAALADLRRIDPDVYKRHRSAWQAAGESFRMRPIGRAVSTVGPSGDTSEPEAAPDSS